MLNPQDENLMIDYVFGSLEESEEAAFSERRNRDPYFDRHYRMILNALRPILEARTDEREQAQTYEKSKNLTARTISFIRANRSENRGENQDVFNLTHDSTVSRATRAINVMDSMNETVLDKKHVLKFEESECAAEKK
ncbi:MAG: hypothetical protein IJF17_01835 [Thermoguttaceae bacterium]|nr:hypothetical protein [Thermoguttaceae bacterium]MDO4424993.1 hypothetical protein [Planctomycetia bacterium]